MAKENKFQEEGSSVFNDPICLFCKHLVEIGQQDSYGGWICKAFPDQIPYAVWKGHWVHDKILISQEGSYTFNSKTYNRGGGKKVKYTAKGEIENVGNDN